MTDFFPRLLVATEFPPNASGGGPAVVRQMLEGWPADRLYWWSVLPEVNHKFGREVAAHFVASMPGKLYPRVTLPQIKARVLKTAWVPFASRHLERTLHKKRPDAVWAIPHQWSIPSLAAVFLRSPGPYHVSVHDFPDAHHVAQRIGTNQTNSLLSSTCELYRLAKSRDAISDAMARDLMEKTGTAADQILHAGLDREDFTYLETKQSQSRATIRIAYAGTIVAQDSFAIFAECLTRIRARLSKPVELRFFGAHSYQGQPWFNPAWMIEYGDLGAVKLKSALRECDWGFAPMELSDDNPRYNRFSLPTKIVSYLGAGLGIIVLGHSASTVSRLAERYSFGIAINESSQNTIDTGLEECFTESDVWNRYGSELLRCARSEFDADLMRQTLWTRLGAKAALDQQSFRSLA